MGRKQHKKGKTPPFIKKLVQILSNDEYKDIIVWLAQGNGFQILNVPKFNQEVLPIFFNHNNFASFVRQVNMYGFVRPKDSCQYVYTNQRFQKGNINSIRFIQRKNKTQIHKNYETGGEEFVLQSQSKEQEAERQNFGKIYDKLVQENQELRKRNKLLLNQLQELTKQCSTDSKSNTLLPQINRQQLININVTQTKSPSNACFDPNEFPINFNYFDWMIGAHRPIQASYRPII